MAREPLYKEVVEVRDGERTRRGVIVEVQRGATYGGLLPTTGPVVSVRVWLDGDEQPEHAMRPPGDIIWA